MATFLSTSPPTFDRNDVAGTVKALCAWARGLQENLDFILGNITRDASAGSYAYAGVRTDASVALANARERISEPGRVNTGAAADEE